MTRPSLFVLLVCVGLAVPALADPALGLWRTEPDRKNLVSLIRIERCGAALCGTVQRALDSQGRDVRTANVGKRLFWGLKPGGQGRYGGGTVHVPLLNVTAKASARLMGDALRVTGCKGPVCDGQTWQRLN